MLQTYKQAEKRIAKSKNGTYNFGAFSIHKSLCGEISINNGTAVITPDDIITIRSSNLLSYEFATLHQMGIPVVSFNQKVKASMFGAIPVREPDVCIVQNGKLYPVAYGSQFHLGKLINPKPFMKLADSNWKNIKTNVREELNTIKAGGLLFSKEELLKYKPTNKYSMHVERLIYEILAKGGTLAHAYGLAVREYDYNLNTVVSNIRKYLITARLVSCDFNVEINPEV